MATSPKRRQKRLSDREAARRARQSTASKAPPADAGAAAAAGEDAIAAAAALNPEAAARLAAAAANGGAEATPPLTMEQLPPEAAKTLGPMLERARAGGAPGGLPDDDKKRAKKFLTLEMELAELLTFPAGPALMAGDEFCGQHFATQGPLLAHQLTVYAESHPSTYNTLQWLARQGSLLVIATSVVGYLVPPAIHHGLPAPEGMRRHYGMAPREQEPPLAAVA